MKSIRIFLFATNDFSKSIWSPKTREGPKSQTVKMVSTILHTVPWNKLCFMCWKKRHERNDHRVPGQTTVVWKKKTHNKHQTVDWSISSCAQWRIHSVYGVILQRWQDQMVSKAFWNKMCYLSLPVLQDENHILPSMIKTLSTHLEPCQEGWNYYYLFKYQYCLFAVCLFVLKFGQ